MPVSTLHLRPCLEEERSAFIERFKAARRLDWRFLLPHPHLGRVAYWGPENDSLWAALSCCCGEGAVFVEALDHLPEGLTFDTVVVRRRPPHHLPALFVRVRAGGVLYAEWYGRWQLARGRRGADGHSGAATSPRAIENALAGHREAQVHFYWHWPSFSSCRRILPLTGAAKEALSANGLGRWWKVGVRWLWQWQLLGYVVPCFSSVIVREEKP